jgi:hypothetical protein
VNHERRTRRFAAGAAILAMLPAAASGQGRGNRTPEPPPVARVAAPIDLTGYWVSIVSEDWRWRMVTPPRGDYNSIPINAEAKKVGDAWDPAQEEAAGEPCKSYGAPALMRVPGRLHITWQDDNTLQVETDAGMQTRLFHFGDRTVPAGEPTWQGSSVAEWQVPRGPGGPFGPGVGEASAEADKPKFGSLKVVTTHLRPGYLRKNGVPYSAKTVLTEHWDVTKDRRGNQWLVITTIVEDETYLQMPWITSLNFRKEPDGSKWDPSPCSARW